jgi:hypothetical protein
VGAVRLGYFEDFGGHDTVLIDGDAEGLNELARQLLVLISGERDVVSLHSLACVSPAKQVEVSAHRAR